MPAVCGEEVTVRKDAKYKEGQFRLALLALLLLDTESRIGAEFP